MTQPRNVGPVAQRRPADSAPPHPRSAVATRNAGRHGARLSPRQVTVQAYDSQAAAPTPRRTGGHLSAVDPATAPSTYGASTAQGRQDARGIAIYIGLDELQAAQSNTTLTQIAQELQAYAKQLAAQAVTSAVIALGPPAAQGNNLDAVRAALSNAPGAAGAAGPSGPMRARIPSRIHPPTLRPQAQAGLRVDIPRREIYVDGTPQKITAKEFDLLATLVSHPGVTLSREQLIDLVWSGQDTDERTVDVHVRRLRNRLGAYSSVVRTLRGAGYRYDDHPDVDVWTATAVR